MLGLENIRKKRNMSRSELASQIGVGVNTIWRYEKGERQPDIDVLKKLGEVLHCTVDDLINPTSTPAELPTRKGA